jgi:cyclomaltodextrinase
MHKVIISYQPPTAGEHTVGIAGDFTNWQIIPLEFDHGIYQKEFSFLSGIYQYKLIVDGQWMNDPAREDITPDPFGGYNSVLILTENAADISLDELIYHENPAFDEHSNFDVPEWVSEGVIYQIFPDRFCNGNPATNPDFSEWYYDDSKTPPEPGKHLKSPREYFHLVDDWYDISGLKQSPYLPKGKPDWWSFYGGDIAGVQQKLDYLLDLGIGTIYFNPLWQAKSNHKYDAADFKRIDPHFASKAEFKAFVSLCRDKGIHIILDIALNHTGETFWAFRDCVEHGEQSKYWNWYDWFKWPLPHPLPENFKPKQYYQCWWGIKDMPDLNYDLARDYIFENAIKDIREAKPNWHIVEHIMEAVGWWLDEMDIDGFRLDVPDEVPFWFWELFRQKVKTLKPDAWLVGELWNHAEQWVSPRYFDSVMNYAHFKDPVIDFFLKGSISQATFLQRLYLGLKSYPLCALHAMMNLLDSHDTWRINEIANGSIPNVKLIVLFQMTYIGTPHIYYGDEIGMQGAKDPDNRRPFNWQWQENPSAIDLHDYYKALIAVKKAHPVLQKGLIRFIRHPALLIFERFNVNNRLQIVINNYADNIEYTLPNPSSEIIFSTHPDACQSIGLITQLPAKSGIIILTD